jgi:hypothetical protein
MRVYYLIGVAVIALSLGLIPILAQPVQADDQMKGQGTLSQEEKGKATEGQSLQNLGTSSRSELGKETERPMRVPEKTDETAHLQNLKADPQVYDLETLEHLRIQDEISSVSF